jgi:hypothetical protein
MNPYFCSNIVNDSISNLFKSFLYQFFNEIEYHLNNTKRNDKYHLTEYGELGLANYFINGIVREDDKHRFLIINEFELADKNNKYSGRVDIILEDSRLNEIYFIEAKREYSLERVPSTDKWSKEKTVMDYNKILEQAKKYLNADWHNITSINKKYLVALVFDSTKFQNIENIKLWYYQNLLDNEFYSFKTFNKKEELLGLACYGIVQEIPCI